MSEKSVSKIEKIAHRVTLRKTSFLAMTSREGSIKKHILYIDTSGERSEVILMSGEKIVDEKSWNGFGDLSETLLVEIEKLLVSQKINFGNLERIVVNSGPGSYTGVRIGVTTANFLAWSLGIPIVAGKIINEKLQVQKLKNQDFILPIYSGEPNITKPKAGRKI